MLDVPRDWTFRNATVARAFDRHVREQLPWYDIATGAVAHIGRHYVPRRGLIYDVGASTGNIGRALADAIEAREARLVAIEESAQMAALYEGPGEIVTADALAYDFEPFDLAVCFLVMMFMPVAERDNFLAKLVGMARRGGAVIVFDKTEHLGGYLGTVLARLTLAGKLAANVEPTEIVAKELSLGGVQRPINAALLRDLGGVEWFRFGEFAGWVIEAPT